MFIDYNYYVVSYGGTKLAASNFQKFAEKSCRLITDETMTRVDDGTINNFPSQLVDNIKKCACDLSERYYDYEKICDNAIKIASGESTAIKSEKAGYAAVEYVSLSDLVKDYANPGTFNQLLRSTLRLYLGPQRINGVVWNLMSKVIKDSCCNCNLI